MSQIRHWADIEEASFAFGMRLLFGIQRLFGRWPFRLCLYPVILYYWLSQPRVRRVSRAYLRRFARHHQRPAPGALATLAHLLAFGEAVMDKLLAWSGDIRPADVDLLKPEIADVAVDSGRGGLIVTAHVGNLELSNVLSARHPTLKLNILTHTRHSVTFNRLLGQLNPCSQVNLLQVSEITPATAIMLSEKVAAGEFVVIAGDRIPVAAGSAVVMAPLLGEDAGFPVGPWLLASLLQCPVYLLWSLKVDGRYQVSFEAFRDRVVLPRTDRGAAATELARAFAARLETILQPAPLQWFNFFDFWDLPPAMNYKIWTPKRDH